ncbi:geranylgeranyl transferase type-2 subunit alpha 1 [Asparagus officinalis]|uniref:geranylgeranyl transferase type-2 subunit alpha 1 n=1 Tax=Asparagus officinalis TaxID=4686 RepID=UPI00098E1DDE|nr:geranylgeranyl transferase type-2 subunit alpha 1 [Asparagus officinalis]
MHNRPRISPAATAEDAAASAAKAAKLRDLQSQLLHNHQNKLYTKEAVTVSAKLLEVNPEVYTAWNYRKLAFKHSLEGVGDAEIVKSLVNEELKIVEVALRQNPKSYGAWHHRKWVLNQGLTEVDFKHEYDLLNQLLKKDPRNFHGWNYRRFVTKLKNVPEVEELKFTRAMIDINFSNYSAWHNRSALFSQLLKQKAEGFESKENILTEEYKLVCNALFTDPNDQSGWFYHLWLLDQTVTPEDPLLISSWPSQGSDCFLSTDLSSFEFSNCNYSLHMGAFPIVLYFNQAVTGVSSSTVTVNSMFLKNENLIWSPLTTAKSREARCWLTYLKISDAKFSDSNSATVEVSIGHLRGIISSSGSHYPHTSQFKFTITMKSIDRGQSEESVEKLIMWKDDQKEFDYGTANEMLLNKLSITEERERKVPKWNLETLSNEIELFKELSDENCKFVNLTLARLLTAQDAMTSPKNLPKQKGNHFVEVLKLLDELIKLDPSHAGYYEDERSLVMMNQATFDEQSIMKYYVRSSELTSTSHRLAGMRLSRLSLTRIGFVERLLWIQMLDLSHNELRSIAGLEALQHLVCLNLSNNKISSFTSLEPLKLMKYLKVLNISSNEIGSHPIDTSKYFCSSPLSHTYEAENITKAFKKGNINVGDYWEAILLFQEMNLIQLDISENKVADEAFGDLLLEVLPTLKWLDGKCVR